MPLIRQHNPITTTPPLPNPMNPTQWSLPRRQFLKTAAVVAAASTLPHWFLEESRALAATTQPLSPNDQPAIALIGCGGMGRGDARSAARFGRVVALCDVDDARLAEAKKLWPDAATFKDFRQVIAREDVHVVICGTMDHWHTLVSMAALGLPSLDEGDDLHFSTALGADQRVRFVNLLDEGGPALAGLSGAGRAGRRGAPLRWRRLRLGPLPLVDLALAQEQPKHLLFPQLEERFARQPGQGQERAVG
jgi:hypothetical protein